MDTSAIEGVSRAGASVRDRWGATLHHAGRRLEGWRRNASGMTHHAARSADGSVRRHPYTAVAAGALAGLVAGLLIARR